MNGTATSPFTHGDTSLCHFSSMCLGESVAGVDVKPSIELRIVSRGGGAETGRILHRESLELRATRAAGCVLPSQLFLLSNPELVSSDGSLPVLFIAGPLVSERSCVTSRRV